MIHCVHSQARLSSVLLQQNGIFDVRSKGRHYHGKSGYLLVDGGSAD